MNRFLPPITCVFVGVVGTLVSSCARDCVAPGVPTPRRPLLVPATDQVPVSSNTRYLPPRRNTAHLPARTPTGNPPGRPHTAHLPPANMGDLPARLERAKARSPVRSLS